MNFEQNVSNKLDEIISLLQNKEVKKSLNLEDQNFKINSDGWKKITVDNKKYLENPEKDVWELLDGDCRGEQLFTYDAAMRETKIAGKEIPSDDQLSELLKDRADLKNVLLPGSRNTDSSFDILGSYLFLWSSTPSGSSFAWVRGLGTSYSSVGRGAYSRAYGFSVRCIKN